MGNRHRYGNLLGYVDISMNLLMSFVVLFVFAFMLMRVEESVTDNSKRVPTSSKLVVHLSWDSISDDDIDLWVRTDNPRSVVGFKNRATANVFLDTDNLGKSSNAVTKQNGEVVSSFGNNENIGFKECTNTHVTVNVHYYGGHDKMPVPVKVELMRTDPFGILYTARLTMDTSGQERTAFQFDLDENCGVTNISTEQSPFVISAIGPPKPNQIPETP